MAHTGRKVYIKLNGTDVSAYFDGVSPSNNTEEFDGTTFQPNASHPVKTTLYGFNDKRLPMTGKWTAAVEQFFNGASGLDGAENVEYVYGPLGHATGQPRIHGQCNVGKYSGPVAQVSGVITFSVEVAATSQTADTFDGGSPI